MWIPNFSLKKISAGVPIVDPGRAILTERASASRPSNGPVSARKTYSQDWKRLSWSSFSMLSPNDMYKYIFFPYVLKLRGSKE